MEAHKLRLETAKASLFVNFPFFGYIVARLNISENSGIHTLCIDSRCNVQYNKDFVGKMSDANLLAVLAHEALHAVFLHTIDFSENIDPEVMNFAADLEVNDIIVNLEHMDFPMNTMLNVDSGEGNNKSEIAGFAPDMNGIFTFIKDGKRIDIKCRKRSCIEIYDDIYQILKNFEFGYGAGDFHDNNDESYPDASYDQEGEGSGDQESGRKEGQSGGSGSKQQAKSESDANNKEGKRRKKLHINSGIDVHKFEEIPPEAERIEESSKWNETLLSADSYDQEGEGSGDQESGRKEGQSGGSGSKQQAKSESDANNKEGKRRKKLHINSGIDVHKFEEIPPEAERIEESSKWNETLLSADLYQQDINPSKSYSSGDCWYGRYISAILKPQIDWRAVLRKNLIELIPFDYTYNMPAKKSYAIGVYEPRILRKPLGVTVCIDVSGSIGQEELTEFLSEVVGVAKAVSEISIRRLFWSTIVDERNDEVFTRKNLRKLFAPAKNINSTGGTYISCVQEYLEKNPNKNTESLHIFLTDGFVGDHNLPKKSLIVISPNGTDEYLKGFAPAIKMNKRSRL